MRERESLSFFVLSFDNPFSHPKASLIYENLLQDKESSKRPIHTTIKQGRGPKSNKPELKSAFYFCQHFSVYIGQLQSVISPRYVGQISCKRSCWKALEVCFRGPHVSRHLERLFWRYDMQNVQNVQVGSIFSLQGHL